MRNEQNDLAVESVDENGRGIRAVFERSDDRFVCRVDARLRDSWTPLLASWPSDDDSDPRPPVFQEAHQQEVDGVGGVVFLTGAASGDYWSQTVQRAPGGAVAAIEFDTSCRRQNPRGAAAERFAASRARTIVVDRHTLQAETGPVRWSILIDRGIGQACITDLGGPCIAWDAESENAPASELRWRFIVRID